MPASKRYLQMWLFATIVLAAALACNLPGQSEPATPTPTEPVPEPTAPATPEPGPTATADPTTGCPAPTDELALHVNPENGFCFLYPAYFEIGAEFERPERVVTIIGPPSEPLGQKVFAVVLSVEHNGPDEGMTAASYAARAIELFDYPTGGPQEERSIGGAPAVVLHDLPGAFVSERRAYLVVNGERYVVSLIPQPEDIPDLTEEANLAWSSVLDSLVFFPPQDPPEYLSSSEVCPSTGAETQARVDEVDGYCYLYPNDFAESADFPDQIVGGPVLGTEPGFGEVRTSLTLGTFGTFPGSTPRELLEPRADTVDLASVRDETIGGWPAVVFRNTAGPWDSRNAIIVVDVFVYTIVNQPWEPDRWPDGIAWLDRLWETVTASTAFFTRWR